MAYAKKKSNERIRMNAIDDNIEDLTGALSASRACNFQSVDKTDLFQTREFRFLGMRKNYKW